MKGIKLKGNLILNKRNGFTLNGKINSQINDIKRVERKFKKLLNIWHNLDHYLDAKNVN